MCGTKKRRRLAAVLAAALMLTGCGNTNMVRPLSKRVLMAMLIAGCGESVYALPEDAPCIETDTYVNEKDKEDTYMMIEYGGREYVCYGTIGRRMSVKEIAACVGYTGGDTNERIFTLSATDDYIMQKYTNGVMDQPGFYRAVDTLGKDIYTPDYIKSLDYGLWDGGRS